MGASRFRTLDSCRGLCAVAVMFFHMDAKTHFYATAFVRNGWVAVDFFFVLSGFVIASAYHRRLRTAADAGRFALRRFGRLYPLHFAVLLVYAGIELVRMLALHAGDAFSGDRSVSALAANLVLIQGFTPDHESWNYPAWSISVELWTNFVFAILAVVFLRRFVVCAAVFAAGAGTFVALSDRLPLPVSPAELDALVDAARSIFGFFLGCIVYSIFYAVRRAGWKPLRTMELFVLPLVAGVVFYADALPGVVAPLLFSAVVFIVAFETGPISVLLQRPACIGLGTISYSIYLTHSVYLLAMGGAVYALGRYLGQPVSVQAGGDDLLVLGGPWAMDAAALLCVGVALFGSAFSYLFIEDPARLFFNRLSQRMASRGDGVAMGQLRTPTA